MKMTKTEYSKIHKWLYDNFGKANKCENIACRKISVFYEWAKIIDKPYDYKRENFMQLCKSCHGQYDLKDGRFNKRLFNPNVNNFKKLRLALGMEQEEFGKLIGVSKSSVCNYEFGKRKPRLPVIRKMMELAKKHKVKMTLEDFLN